LPIMSCQEMFPEAWCEIPDSYDECSDPTRDDARTCSRESSTDQNSSDLSFRDLSSGIGVDCSQLDETIPFNQLNLKFASNSQELNIKKGSNSQKRNVKNGSNSQKLNIKNCSTSQELNNKNGSTSKELYVKNGSNSQKLNVKNGSNSQKLNVKNGSNSRLLARTPSVGVYYDHDATGKCFCDPVSSKSSSGSVKCCSNSTCGPDSGECGYISPTPSLTSVVSNGSDISWIDEDYQNDVSNNLMAMDLNILADCSEELVLDEACARDAVIHLHQLLSLNLVDIHCFGKNRVLKPLKTILERTASSDLKLTIAKLMVRVWEDSSYWGRITISSEINDQVLLKTCNGTGNKELERIACQLQEEYYELSSN